MAPAFTNHRALLEEVLAGDPGAWVRFYRVFNPRIERWIADLLRTYGLGFSRDDLQDFSAELWTAALRDQMALLRRYDPDRGCSVAGWLRLLAQRCTIDQLRARGCKQRLREQGAEMDLDLSTTEPPDSQLERAEQARLAARAMAQLKLADRLFLRQYLETSQPAHLATSLGISVGAVHSRQFKIRNKLRQLIQAEAQRAALRVSAYPYACAGAGTADRG